MNIRARAARILVSVLSHQQHLSEVFQATDDALTKAICFGVCREYYHLDAIYHQLIDKPLAKKYFDIYALILIGIYQLETMQTPNHAAVAETVDAAIHLKKPWAKKLINALLRKYLRSDFRSHTHNSHYHEKHEEPVYNHPQWFIDKLKTHYPNHWQAILLANQQHPPMTLRVNLNQYTPEDYIHLLAKKNMIATKHPIVDTAISLQQAVSITDLPGFDIGAVSVQDASAQLAATLLDLQPNANVLDACAAPGGKTGHLLEACSDIRLTAIDCSESRLKKVKANLDRLNYQATLMCADASDTASWWNGELFDRILLDTPCSATGIIRRQPDIKLHRKADDIAQINTIQINLLNQLWPLLKPGGQLLYVTCSILPEENQAIIQQLTHPYHINQINSDWGIADTLGKQILPTENNMDGFYYALLQK